MAKVTGGVLRSQEVCKGHRRSAKVTGGRLRSQEFNPGPMRSAKDRKRMDCGGPMRMAKVT